MTKMRMVASAAVMLLTCAAGACGDDSSNSNGNNSNGNNSSAAAGGDGGAGGAATNGPGPGSTGSGGMGGMTGAGGSGPSGWAGEVPDLTTDAECLSWAAVTPANNEAGHLYTVRLIPDSYPFEVTEVVYELGDDGQECDATQAHRVEVYVASETVPPNMPMSPLVLNIPAVSGNTGIRIVTETLSPSITLNAGEFLFVAVEMPTPGSSCIATCEGATVFDQDYWSNATMAPYNWATLESFGFEIHARIGANGPGN